MDLLIATAAVLDGAPLVTRNIKHFADRGALVDRVLAARGGDARKCHPPPTPGATLITTHKAVKDWQELLADDEAMAAALLDRLLHRCHPLNIRDRSYRLRDLERGDRRAQGPRQKQHLYELLLALQEIEHSCLTK